MRPHHAVLANSFKIIRSRPVTFLQTVGVCNLFRIHTSELSCKCGKQKTYRITKSFRCNTYKKRGGRGPRLSNSDPPSSTGCPLSPISYPLFPFFSNPYELFCTFLQFFALRKKSTSLFSSDSTLFAQNMGGGGRGFPRALRAARSGTLLPTAPSRRGALQRRKPRCRASRPRPTASG
jgi:hypothetical protein